MCTCAETETIHDGNYFKLSISDDEWVVGRPRLLRACAIILLTLPVWFSANSHLDDIIEDYKIATSQASFVTMGINIGFTIAATVSGMVQLPDRASPAYITVVGTLLCAVFSLLLIINLPFSMLLMARLATGASLSLVFPPLVRYVTSWFKLWRGLALGFMVGSFTVAVAIPDFLKAVFPGAPWQWLIAGTSLLAMLASIPARGVNTGPYLSAPPPFSFGKIWCVLGKREWLLVTLSYMGHSFELFAGWAYMGVFLQYDFGMHGITDNAVAPFASFIVVSVGSIGCVVAGFLADKIGRKRVIVASHCLSGIALVTLPFLVSFASPFVVSIVAGLWGLTVNGDSAQYQATLSELIDSSLLGTAFTLTIACGFMMTAFGIYVVPVLLANLGWDGIFPCIALGPALGLVAMIPLTIPASRS